jgi:hypothetical protein
MHCMTCGAEMRPIQVLRDVVVPGCERLTLECLSCADIERRFVFRRASEPAEPVPIRIAISPVPGSSMWARAVACLRGRLAHT